jgi:hypothetical protein
MEPQSVAGIAFGHAVEWRKVLRTAQFVLPYQYVPLTKIGVFAPGSSYTTDGERLLSVPKGFDGAILVDLQGLVSRPVGLIDAESVSQDSEAFDKITSQPAIGRVAIIPRTDLGITLFSEDRAQSGSCELPVTAAKVRQTEIKYCGKMIRAYTEIELYRNRRNFLVIRPIFGPLQWHDRTEWRGYSIEDGRILIFPSSKFGRRAGKRWLLCSSPASSTTGNISRPASAAPWWWSPVIGGRRAHPWLVDQGASLSRHFVTQYFPIFFV